MTSINREEPEHPLHEDNDLLRTDDVVQQLLDRPWLRKRALTCVLPAVRINGEWRFHRRDLENWIAQETRATKP